MDHDPGLTVAEGDRVEVGTQLGYVGERVHAVGTDPHAHIDRLPPTYESRPACSGEGCQQYPFENVQPEFVDAYQEIPDQ